ncbi:MAG: hypothetical protein E7614_03500 [Ruminococcaceae bacterium]|nr:hypothetical protein [Oscillospiraceae bacterium]
MRTKTVFFKRALSFILVLCMLVSVPQIVKQSALAESEYTKIADDSTKDLWKTYFGSDVLNTENAGSVWTDKSVFTSADEFKDYGISLNDENGFLVALSVIASNKSVSGLSNVPTDTMIVLDLSSSMYPSRDPATVNTMVDAVNNTITSLQSLNIHNRVGVSVYFGGSTLWESKADSSKVLLPLDRYSHSENYFLKTTVSGGTRLESVDVNSGVSNSAGAFVSGSHVVADVAGTYAQLGIIDAMNQFLRDDIEPVIPANAEYQAGVSRVPVIVLMSDGEPTAATNNYTQKEDFKMGNNQVTNRNNAETDFVTQLTAAYAKEKIDAKYVDTTPLFYTLSLGNSISMDIMDPKANDEWASKVIENNEGYTETERLKALVNYVINSYWQTLMTYGEVSIKVQNYNQGSYGNKTEYTYGVKKAVLEDGTLFPSDISKKYYVDQSFTASNADALSEAFKSIVDKIALQSRYFPTLVEDNENHDGYVSFVDNVGKYMSVTDIKGIVIGDVLFSGADLASNFVPDGGSLGTATAPTALGKEMVNAVKNRLGIEDAGIAEALIAQAYNKGQLSYKNDKEFSNYIGWYANAKGEFLGFWYEGIETMPNPEDPALTDETRPAFIIKSYGYLGAVDEDHGVSKSDMMYATVQVRQSMATGEQKVIFSVPASLIPMVNYDIKLDRDGKVSSFDVSGATAPMSLVYEIGLNKNINQLTVADGNVVDPSYVAENTNEDGSVNFYTNQYETDNSIGYGKVNAYSYFRPSHQNEKYYFQESTTVYQLVNGAYEKYIGQNAPDVNGKYYQAMKVYSGGNTPRLETVYHKLSTEAISVVKALGDGTWYVPFGTVHVDTEGYIVNKTSNKTNTLRESYVPFVDIEGHLVSEADHSFVVGATLGNNGIIRVRPASGIKISKSVEGTDSGSYEFAFTVESKNETNGTYKAVKTSANGNTTETTVSFENGKTTVSLKAGESIAVIGLGVGNTYVLTEVETLEYTTLSVNGSKEQTSAVIVTEKGKILSADFVNVKRGTGNVTVTKTVEHELGAEYTIPYKKKFDVSITLSGVGSKNARYKVLHSGDESVLSLTTDENGKFPTVTLGHNEQIEIFDLPVGTTVSVVEENVPTGFTASYRENGQRGDGVVNVTPTSTSVEVVNYYVHEKVSGETVILSGVKNLNDEYGNPIENWGDAEFTVILERHDENGWVEIGRKTVNNESRTFTFDFSTEIYSIPGVYSYQLYEYVPADEEKIDGMLYDPVYHTFSIVVTDTYMSGGLKILRIHSEHTGREFKKDENGNWIIDPSFTNVQYNTTPAVARIPIQKKLENLSGSSLATLAHHEFGLYVDADCTITASIGNGILSIDVPPTDAVGETLIDVIFDEVGEYTFYIKEIDKKVNAMKYDTSVVKVDVTVTAEGVGGKLNAEVKYSKELEDGELVFVNKYEPEDIVVDLDVRKELIGRELTENDVFTFEVREGDKAVLTGRNDATGKVTFDGSLAFDKVGIYNYTVVETSRDKDGIISDKTVYNVRINVFDRGDGALSAEIFVAQVVGNVITFRNTYTAKEAEFVLNGEKVLEGRPLLNDEFTFVMAESDKDGNVLENGKSYTAKNFTDGHFQFEKLTFNKAGEYYFTVYELAESVLRGVKYDETRYQVKIEVYDNGAGALEVNASIFVNGEEVQNISFINEYVPMTAYAFIPGTKLLVGKILEEGMFEFVLLESDENWTEGKVIETVKNCEDGRITFAEIEYKEAGSYYYLVKEVYEQAEKDGILYDDTVYRIRVDITDDRKGILHSAVHLYDADGVPQPSVEFVNEYVETPPAKPGDSAEAVFWMIMLAISASGFALIVSRKKKRYI